MGSIQWQARTGVTPPSPIPMQRITFPQDFDWARWCWKTGYRHGRTSEVRLAMMERMEYGHIFPARMMETELARQTCPEAYALGVQMGKGRSDEA